MMSETVASGTSEFIRDIVASSLLSLFGIVHGEAGGEPVTLW